jgi:hypothetical protein
MVEEIRIRLSKSEVKDFIRKILPGMLSGRITDKYGIARACQAALVHAAMKDIQGNYEDKSQGGGGADGNPWEPLRPATIFKRGERVRGQPGQPGKTGDMWWAIEAADMQKNRKMVYREELRRLLAAGVERKEAQRQASILAKAASRNFLESRKRQLGITGMPGEPGSALILIDTQRLIQSASAGQLSGDGLNLSYQPGSVDQVVTYGRGFVQVDSAVEYGDYHEHSGTGSSTGTDRPARPWKWGDKQIPSEWLANWSRAFSLALQECVADILRQLTKSDTI